MAGFRYERIVKALNFEEPDRVPWYQGLLSCAHHVTGRDLLTDHDFDRARTRAELDHLVGRVVDDHVTLADRLEWSLITVYTPFRGEGHTPPKTREHLEVIRRLRKRVDREVMVAAFIEGGVLTIPDGAHLADFCYRLADDPASVHAEAKRLLDLGNDWGRRCVDAGAEILFLADDVAFNPGPFLSPKLFAEFVTPYLREHVAAMKNLGVKVVYHSDGNLMPILDQIVETGIDGLNPIDPMAGMDIAEIKRRYGKRLALFGNVQCDLVHRGPRDAIRESTQYCLESAKAGGGFVLVCSSEVFYDTPWEHFQEVIDAWKRWGRYGPAQGPT